jgi:hypothetical protein
MISLVPFSLSSMRSVDEYRKIVVESDLHMFLENLQLRAGVFVQADFSDSKHIVFLDEIGNQRHHFAGEYRIVRLLGVDAEPAKVLDTESGGSLGFVFRELAEIVVKSIRRGAVVTRPERRFTEDFTASKSEFFVVIRRAADHVSVRFNVWHRWKVRESRGRGWEEKLEHQAQAGHVPKNSSS